MTTRDHLDRRGRRARRSRPGGGAAPSKSRLSVVGIGASAGGLEALQRFFEHVSAAPGAAFVVVQHLSPDFKSLMEELRRALEAGFDEHLVKPLDPARVIDLLRRWGPGDDGASHARGDGGAAYDLPGSS